MLSAGLKREKWTSPGRLTDRYSVPVRVVETRNVQRVIHTPADEIVLDFGQNFAGWITFVNAVGEGVILYTYILENGLLLRNISKMHCQSAKICYNKGVATFWQQKISKPE